MLVKLVLQCGIMECRTRACEVSRSSLSTGGDTEPDHSFSVQCVQEFELSRQLMGLLPLGGKLGPFLVKVVVRESLARERIPAEGPEAIEVNFLTHC